MADHIDAGDNVFIYMGGEQEFAPDGTVWVAMGRHLVPDGVVHAVIHPSVKEILYGAFAYRQQLVSVEMHDGVEIIEYEAFYYCESLRGIKLVGVKEIGQNAFIHCIALTDVEFGDELDTIGHRAFCGCNSLRSIKIPSVRTVENYAFHYCEQLTDVEFGSNLETFEAGAFSRCPNLRRIAIPLKHIMIPFDYFEGQYTQFAGCHNLTTVDLVGAEAVHKTISSLLLETWRNEVRAEIDRINKELPNIDGDGKTNAVRIWINAVVDRLEHYKAEHNRLLKEHMTQLELAVWKAKLDEKEGKNNSTLEVQTKRAKVDMEAMRQKKRITSGASIVIKNVLPFMELVPYEL
eukprot:CAMPEP_0201740842 /NCGR_PEP_ID=MMETSP0593-20130828/46509_1 /ASSEMBLY_ACC=CAM_ASM_000672 /TAXON_ID=267983 /ORGANISM="Skeletonema japonicum, Strain CCMP2506" /LENGTH=347 /DNA_ID=CAMNT_0048235163 /DNA_START=58 /DNA_END=1101 /DNA_ORIENTATION=+